MSAIASPWPLSVEKYAPVCAGRVAPSATPLADLPRPTSAQLTVALDVLERTGWVEAISPLLPQEQRAAAGVSPGGRKRTLTVQALLLAMVLLPLMERAFIVKDMWRLLDKGLDAPTRKRLGLGKKAITERMVSRLYGQIVAALNPSCYAESNEWLFDPAQVRARYELDESETLDEHDLAINADAHLGVLRARLELFIRAGLRATHPDEYAHAGDFALDATFIESWENPKTTRRRTTWMREDGEAVRRPLKPHLMADPDARWWSKRAAGRGKLHGAGAYSGLGYAITALTWVQEDLGPSTDAPDLPRLIDHLSVRGARGPMWAEGCRTLDEMVAHHEDEDAHAGREHRQRGDLLADREYSRVAAWHKHAHIAGFTPHFTSPPSSANIRACSPTAPSSSAASPTPPECPSSCATSPRRPSSPRESSAQPRPRSMRSASPTGSRPPAAHGAMTGHWNCRAARPC